MARETAVCRKIVKRATGEMTNRRFVNVARSWTGVVPPVCADNLAYQWPNL